MRHVYWTQGRSGQNADSWTHRSIKYGNSTTDWLQMKRGADRPVAYMFWRVDIWKFHTSGDNEQISNLEQPTVQTENSIRINRTFMTQLLILTEKYEAF
jgi:hypothetical protein